MNDYVKSYPLDSIESIQSGHGKPAVLFLHGWGSNPSALKGLFSPISAQRQIQAIALPGFGGSPEPDQPWNTNDYVELVKRWIDSNNLGTVDIVAHSFGGRVTIGLAAKYPAMINKIVLMGSAGLIIPRSFGTKTKITAAKLLNRIADSGGVSLRQWAEKRKSKLGSSDYRNASPVMKETLKTVISEDLSNYLRLIKQSALLIWGTEDTAVPLSAGRKMTRLLENARILELQNAGHYVFLDRKNECLKSIWEFLELKSAW